MILTDEQYAWLISVLGRPSEAAETEFRGDLDDRYTRLETATGVAIEVLRERRAKLLSSPLSVSVPGAVSVNSEGNVRGLNVLITQLGGDVTTDPDATDETDTGGLIVVPLVNHWAR